MTVMQTRKTQVPQPLKQTANETLDKLRRAQLASDLKKQQKQAETRETETKKVFKANTQCHLQF